MQKQVVFCGHRADPEALSALADLSVLISAREGLPRVAVQSIAAGCPMIVQNLLGIDEITDHGRNGLIADAGNMDDAVRRMFELLQDDQRLQQLRKWALATDVSAWSVDALGRRTTSLYGLPVRRSSFAAAGHEVELA